MKAAPFEPLDPGTYRELVRARAGRGFRLGRRDDRDDHRPRAEGTRDHRREVDVRDGRHRDRGRSAFASSIPPCRSPSTALTDIAASAGPRSPTSAVHAAALLTAERTALNFLQHLSGIATLTRQFVDVADGRITVLDTRKTTPIFPRAGKIAVRAGGGVNHRSGLDAGILIEDNHIRLAGGVGSAVTLMRKRNREMPTEVEAQSLAQVDEAPDAGAEIILLDNLSTDEILEAVRRAAAAARKRKSRAASRRSGCANWLRRVPISSPLVR